MAHRDNDKCRSFAWPRLAGIDRSARILVTAIVISMNIAMLGAGGQILVHDIIPTFFNSPREHHGGGNDDDHLAAGQSSEQVSLLENGPFLDTLRWTHIHLFGMSIIFIFMGAVTAMLSIRPGLKPWLIGLPFLGIWIDIAAVWLKRFVDPGFFWLHLPGGGLFGTVFAYVSIAALLEMWFGKAGRDGIEA